MELRLSRSNPSSSVGHGLTGDWERPSWLTSSVDNFWLVIAMRHGLPAIILLGFGLAAGMWAVIRAKSLDRTASQYRTGYVIALVGLYFTLATVHIWGDTSSFLMCFIGAGLWLASAGQTVPVISEAPGHRPVSMASQRRGSVAPPMAPETLPGLSSPPHSPRQGLPTSRFAPRHDRKHRSTSEATPVAAPGKPSR